jgi:hypothetical protein
MSFEASWLDLREVADQQARDTGLLARARAHLGKLSSPLILDLGSGTGAMMRAIGPVSMARWRLIDHDTALLEEAARRAGPQTTTERIDLGRLDRLRIGEVDFVTASALLDLAGADWLDGLAKGLANAGIGLYATLSFNGLMEWSPRDFEDPAVIEAFNRHQTRDKGLGPALGPEAWAHLVGRLRDLGHDVVTAASDWHLGDDDVELSSWLTTGVAKAANEAGARMAGAWLQRRRELLPATTCRVGHVDLLALPARGRMSQSKMTSVPRP